MADSPNSPSDPAEVIAEASRLLREQSQALIEKGKQLAAQSEELERRALAIRNAAKREPKA